MAEAATAYLINEDGQVEAVSPEEAPEYLATGSFPAGKQQIDDFKAEQAFHEKYGTTGQQLKTFGEGAFQALTLGLSDFVEKALGVKAEDIANREKENPKTHMAGVVTGVAAPLIASGGTSALAEGAGFTAPGLIARAGEAGAEGLSGLLGEGSSAAARIAAKAASSGLGSSIEGAAYGLGQVVHESALGDPNLTASHAIEEIGLSALLGGGIGAGTGALGHLVGEAAQSGLGAKLDEWAHRFEGNRNLSAATGGANAQALIRREAQKIGIDGVNQLGREGGKLGLVSAFSTPGETLARSQDLMEQSGQAMGDLLQAADAVPGAAKPSAADVIGRAKAEILGPLKANPLNSSEASQIEGLLNDYQAKLGAYSKIEEVPRSGWDIGQRSTEPPSIVHPEGRIDFEKLHDIRKDISKKIYGFRGNQAITSEYKDALHDLRSILSDEINKGLESTPSLGKEAQEAWKGLNRKYQVASVFEKFAEKGLTAARGNNIIPFSAMASGLAGHIAGGPIGGLALGALSYGAKRFGSGILGAGARTVRELIDEGAAEGLASKTGEALAEARQAGAEAGRATGAARAWNMLGEHLEKPVVAPGQDLLRDIAKDQISEGGEGTPLETVAALSRLERANQRVENRVDNEISALFKAAPRVARSEALSGISAALAQGPGDALAAHSKRAESVRQFASNPEALQQKLTALVSDLEGHAPQTAQALQVAVARCVGALAKTLPPQAPRAPLQKPADPSPEQVAKFQRCYEAVEKPTLLLRQAAAGVLTPDVIAAVMQAQPQRFAAMQGKIAEKLATHKQAIPYAQRQMLSMLMGRDMDGTTTPAMLQASQLTHVVAASPRHPGIKPSSAGLGKLSLSRRMLTPAQASAQRQND